ncbi:MAG: LuxR C-terminal-related transcriptional regulator [Sandaracinaceae bacterium]
MLTDDDLTILAHDAPSLDAFVDAALPRLAEAFDADVALFAARRGTELARWGLGIPAAVDARLDARWDRYAPDVRVVQDAALRDGAAIDRRVLGDRGLERSRVYDEIMRPVRGTESLFVMPSFRGCKLGFVMLGRVGRRFTDRELTRGRALRPTLSIAIAAHARPIEEPELAVTLSPSERDLLEYLQLGCTSKQIALARGTSFFTVRNQLSALYRKLGVGNRTEAVGLLRRRH